MNSQQFKDPDFFKDWVNPTKEELTKWAYGEYCQPGQDFNLMVTNDPVFLLKFIEDESCRTRIFLLQALYIYIGDQVRANSITKDLVQLLEEVAESDNKDLKNML